MNNKIITGIAIFALVVSFIAITKGGTETIIEKTIERIGVASGPTKTQHQFFDAGFTTGGRVATTSTETLSTYTTEIKDFQQMPVYYDWLPNRNLTITINATSTFSYVPKVGNVSTMYFRNASTTAVATITFAAENSSVDLQINEATGGDLILNGLDWAKLTFIRESANLVTILFDEFTEGD